MILLEVPVEGYGALGWGRCSSAEVSPGIGNGWAQAWALVIEVARPGMETAEEAQAVRLGGGYEHHWRRGEEF